MTLSSTLVALVCAVTMAGCFGLGKRDDATSPVSAGATTVQQFVHTIEPGSSVNRASGSATYTRLSYLFPAATSTLPELDFAFQGASGLNRAFGSQSRPADALAQMALRSKVATLCADYAADPATQLFKLDTGNQLLTGESAPSDPAQRAALAVARNAWLHPYAVSDSEVQELIGLYNQMSQNGGVSNAKRGLCETALLAPQFWMGTPEADDPAKRVSVELFRRIPPMQEMQDYLSKKFTIDAYFDQLLANSQAQAGFLKTMHQWHEEWLGFRDFMEPTTRYQDRRASQIDESIGPSNMMAATFGADTVSVSGGPAQTIVSTRISSINPATCTSNAAQPFDPDTKMIAWEHKNFETGAFNFVGGFVRVGTSLQAGNPSASTLGRSGTIAALSALGLMPVDAATQDLAIQELCDPAKTGVSYVADQDGVLWARCNGMVQLTTASASRIRQSLNRIMGYLYAWHLFSLQTNLSAWPMNGWCGGATDVPGCINYFRTSYATSIRNAFIDDYVQLLMRIKRLSGGSVQLTTPAQSIAALKTANPGQAFYTAFMAKVLDQAAKPYTTITNGAQPVAYAPYAAFDTATGNTTHINGQVTSVGGEINTLYTQISGASSWYYLANLVDTRPPTAISSTRYNYALGGMDRFGSSAYLGGDEGNKMLPIQDVANGGGWLPSERRVHRYGGISNTWQDGYSTVSLWHTGQQVSICNNADRLWASCFFRPNSSVPVVQKQLASYRADLSGLWGTFYTWQPDSVMHPHAATAFYCSAPNLNAIKTYNPANPQQGYTKYGTGPGTYGVNTIASNIDLQLDGSAAAGTALGKEGGVFKEIYDQLRDEPYKLINHVVLENDDYRKLLTANYTYGNACFKFYYDTQGYYLPSHPQASGVACSGPGGAEAKFFAGTPIDTGHIASYNGQFEGETPGQPSTRKRMWDKLYGGAPAQLPPRLYSGILTMPAFVAPVATKARGIAARYFTRLLCDQPNFYDPSKDPSDPSGKSAMHTSFISTRKHLATDCYQCHRNLDPLSSALSWTYRGLLHYTPDGEALNDLGGEGGRDDYLGELDAAYTKGSAMAGLRHGGATPSAGAFMGQPVSGIADLGQKLADSEKFASCVTQTVFTNLFGRSVQFSDAKFFNQMVGAFRDPAGANYRYINLIKAMIKSDNFQRKN